MNFQAEYERFYQTLMVDFVDFWTEKAPDREYGGYLCGFDRDGALFFEDKSVWLQGRMLWMFSKLYSEYGQKEQWLEAAHLGYRFINEHCFAPSGHMYFKVTRDGRPLVERRYYFSEAFAIMGYVEYYLATGLAEAKERALATFRQFYHYYTTPGIFAPKVDPRTRQNKGHSIVMIAMNVAQSMRKIDADPLYDEMITKCIDTIFSCFVKPEEKALFETVGKNGERLHTSEGRLINPGHSMETAWFMMQEAIHRKDKRLMADCCEILHWSLSIGWDREQEGIFYFQDIEGKPVMSLEWDMKLFWPHCEAMIALLYAYRFDQDPKHLDWFCRIRDYIYRVFPDPGHPEWFGHLHRDGTPINTIKGSDWKSPFHNVRAFMLISEQLKAIADGEVLEF